MNKVYQERRSEQLGQIAKRLGKIKPENSLMNWERWRSLLPLTR